MDQRELIIQVFQDFNLLIPYCSAVYLYGSYATGMADSRSDIDICLIAGPDIDHVSLLSRAWQNIRTDLYDIRVFEQMPLYLQMEVIHKGVPVISPDPPALGEYFYYFRKRWDDQRFYLRPVTGAV